MIQDEQHGHKRCHGFPRGFHRLVHDINPALLSQDVKQAHERLVDAVGGGNQTQAKTGRNPQPRHKSLKPK